MGLRWNGLKRALSDIFCQKRSSAAFAPADPPSQRPSARTAAFMAPAEVPEMPSSLNLSSSSILLMTARKRRHGCRRPAAPDR